MNGDFPDSVVIVQNEHERGGRKADVVEQGRDESMDGRRLRKVEKRLYGPANRGLDLVEGGIR